MSHKSLPKITSSNIFFFSIIIYLLLLVNRGGEAYVILRSGSLAIQYTTLDPFQIPMSPYNKTGLLINLVPASSGKSCKFASPMVPIEEAQLLEFTGSIVFVYWGAAEAAGCHNLYELSASVVGLNASMAAKKLPSIQALLVFASRTYMGVIGSPVGEKYVSHSTSVPDSAPLLPTVWLYPEDALDFYNTFGEVMDPVTATLVQEPGAWNAVFLSVAYQSTVWAIFIVNTMLVIYAVYRIIHLYRTKALIFDLRTCVFCMGIVSTTSNFLSFRCMLMSSVVYCVALPMRLETLVRFHLELFSSLIFNISFFLLLLLWYFSPNPNHGIN